MKKIECDGEISRVVVHARGAVVTRRVMLPEEVTGDLCCVVTGMKDRFREGSHRVALGPGEGRPGVVVARRRLPDVEAQPGPTSERVQSLQARLSFLDNEIKERNGRLRHWEALCPSPGEPKRLREEGVSEQVEAALLLSGLADEGVEKLQAEVRQLREEYEKLKEEFQAALVEDSQTSEESRAGTDVTTWEAEVQLLGVEGVEYFELNYVVDAARWWPAYRIGLDSETSRVKLEVEGLVAQRSGVDWTGVELSLSTAELDLDARLPELTSLRIGRRQAPKPSGYRPAPEGREELFRSYDQARKRLADGGGVDATEGIVAKEASVQYGSPPRTDGEIAMDSDSLGAGPSGPSTGEVEAFGASTTGSLRSAMRSEAAPRAPMSRPAPAPGGGPSKKMRRRMSAPPEQGPTQSEISPPSEIEPDEQWLDFQDLRLGGPTSTNRGQLYRPPSPGAAHGVGAISVGGDAPTAAVDPRSSRGHFDYRYDGDGVFDIPSDGLVHKMRLLDGQGPGEWRFRCVPRQDQAVYREIFFRNPLDVALLDGPAQIFIDGDFAARTQLERVDRGGEVRLGLGTEQRIQVVRNARFDEDVEGLLKGKRVLTHDVEVHLRSSLGYALNVEVLERLPVTDDDSVVVTLESESPKGRSYDQSERGRPIRGGRAWTLSVPEAGEARLEYSYQIQIRARHELVGGNRRES